MDLDSLLGGMEKSSSSSSSTYFTEGNYTVQVKEIEYRPGGHKGTTVIFHFTILTSNNPDVQAGATRSWFCKLEGDGMTKDKRDRNLADAKSIIFATSGKTVKDVGTPEKNPNAHAQATKVFKAAIDPDFAAKAGVPGNYLIGKKLAVECTSVTLKGGGPFTKHAWSPLAAAPATAAAE